MKKIYIITCNAKKQSLKEFLVQAYIEEAKKKHHDVRTVNIYDLQIDFLHFDNNEVDTHLTEELKDVQQNIIWADQIVFVYPVWALGIPAKLKALIERVFQENVLLKYDERGPKPIFKNKTSVIMQSYAMPTFFMKYFFKDLPYQHMKIVIDKWSGFKIEKRFDFGGIDTATEKQKAKWEKCVRSFVASIK
jgi:putative NADPH-quinone reductase